MTSAPARPGTPHPAPREVRVGKEPELHHRASLRRLCFKFSNGDCRNDGSPGAFFVEPGAFLGLRADHAEHALVGLNY